MNIKNVAVLGTGTMGHGIALTCAQAGLKVALYGRTDASLERGMNGIRADLKRARESGKLDGKACTMILDRIKGVKTIAEAAKEVDFVIESVAEDLELKQNIFSELDELCREAVVLSSNTSGLSPTDLALKCKHPDRVAIAHFWNPAQYIPLVEVVPGKLTSSKTLDTIVEWVKYIGKEPVRLEKECLGFIGNRLQLALLREALYIVEQGWAKAEEVDKAMEFSHGRRLPVTGPLCSADLGGLDIFNNVSSYLFKDLCNSTEPSKLLKDNVDNGHLGSKTGQGFYKWEPKLLEERQRDRVEVLSYFLERDKAKLKSRKAHQKRNISMEILK